MTYTYGNDPWSNTNTDGSKTDTIRLLVGDVDSTQWLLTDEEIGFFLEDNPDSVYFAAAAAADSISGKFSRQSDKSIGRTQISLSQRSAQYATLAAKLRSKSYNRTNIAVPYCSTAQTSLPDNSDLVVPPFFERKAWDYDGSSNSVEYQRDHYVP